MEISLTGQALSKHSLWLNIRIGARCSILEIVE
jgi:hypothetical protein